MVRLLTPLITRTNSPSAPSSKSRPGAVMAMAPSRKTMFTLSPRFATIGRPMACSWIGRPGASARRACIPTSASTSRRARLLTWTRGRRTSTRSAAVMISPGSRRRFGTGRETSTIARPTAGSSMPSCVMKSARKRPLRGSRAKLLSPITEPGSCDRKWTEISLPSSRVPAKASSAASATSISGVTATAGPGRRRRPMKSRPRVTRVIRACTAAGLQQEEDGRLRGGQLRSDSAEVGNGARHLIRCLERLGIHLVGALGRDERGDLLDHVHVGGFHPSLAHQAEAHVARNSLFRRAGGRRLAVEIVADRLQPRVVDEGRDVQLTDDVRLHLVLDVGHDFAILVDLDVHGVLRDRDAWLDLVAIHGHDHAFRRKLEGAGTGIGLLTVGQFHDKVSPPVERQVQPVFRVDQAALGVNAGDGGRLYAKADVHARGHHIAAVSGEAAGPALRLVKQVLKFGTSSDLGIGLLTVGQFHDKVSPPVERQVQPVFRVDQAALGVNAGDGGRLYAKADVHARGHHIAAVSGEAAGPALRLVKQVLKFGTS